MSQTASPTAEYLSVREVARILRVHEASIYRAVSAGRLPYVRLNATGAIRIPAAALEPQREE